MVTYFDFTDVILNKSGHFLYADIFGIKDVLHEEESLEQPNDLFIEAFMPQKGLFKEDVDKLNSPHRTLTDLE